jgi:hypothetical protein
MVEYIDLDFSLCLDYPASSGRGGVGNNGGRGLATSPRGGSVSGSGDTALRTDVTDVATDSPYGNNGPHSVRSTGSSSSTATNVTSGTAGSSSSAFFPEKQYARAYQVFSIADPTQRPPVSLFDAFLKEIDTHYQKHR